MNLTHLKSALSLQNLMFFLVSYFLCIQAWDQTPTTNVAILIWLVGFASWAVKRDSLLTVGQKKIITSSLVVFLGCLISWLLSDYELDVKKIESDTRFLLFFITVIAVNISKLTLNQFSIALLLSGISYGCSALYEHHILNVYRVNGDENAVTFGNGAALIASCLAFIYLSKVNKIIYWLAPISITFALIAAVYSGTRGSFLVLLPLSLIAFYKLNTKGRITTASVTALLILLLFSFSNVGSSFDRAKNNAIAYFNQEKINTSTGLRLEQWKAATCIFQQYPVFGTGPRTFIEANNDPREFCSYSSVKRFHQAHSLYFNTLATKGLVGILALCYFFFTIIYYPFKEKSASRYITLAAVIAMLSYGLTVDLFFKQLMVERHLVLLAIIIGLNGRKQ